MVRFGVILALLSLGLTLTNSVATPLLHTSISSQSSSATLERRTNLPPERGLTLSEWTERKIEAERQMAAAFLENPALRSRVYRVLGLHPEHEGKAHFSDSEMNNALRQAGYEGVLFPELDELEPVAREDAQAWDEYEYQFRRAAEQIYRAFETVPGLWDRVAAIMTRLLNELQMEGETTGLERVNKALREAGYTGPLYPVTIPGSRSNRSGGSKASPSGGGSGGLDVPDGLKSVSFDDVPSQTGFMFRVTQSLGKALRQGSDAIKPTPRPGGSPSHSPLHLPDLGSPRAFKPI